MIFMFLIKKNIIFIFLFFIFFLPVHVRNSRSQFDIAN